MARSGAANTDASSGSPPLSPDGGDGSTEAAAGAGNGAPADRPFAIQIGAFRTRARAEAVLRDAEARTGLAGTIRAAGTPPWHQIFLGSFVSEDEARSRAGALRHDGRIEDARIRLLPDP